MYDSIYKIPSRVFFRILNTGDVTLLDYESNIIEEYQEAEKSKDNKKLEELNKRIKLLEETWLELLEKDQELTNDSSLNKFLDISSTIEDLKCQQIKISLAVDYLKIVQNDNEIKQYLIGIGHQFTDNIEKDLKRIQRLNKDLNIQIGKWEKLLPKSKENTKQESFDKLVIGYSSILGQTFRANDITQSEFRALEQNVKIKLETANSVKER